MNTLQPNFIELLSTILFFIAIIHTFLVSKLKMIANDYSKNSIKHKFFYLLSEVEIVFGFWSFLFLLIFITTSGIQPTMDYLESLIFTEPAFVFVVMCVSATRPIILLAEKIIFNTSKLLPFSERLSFYISV